MRMPTRIRRPNRGTDSLYALKGSLDKSHAESTTATMSLKSQVLLSLRCCRASRAVEIEARFEIKLVLNVCDPRLVKHLGNSCITPYTAQRARTWFTENACRNQLFPINFRKKILNGR